MRTPRLSGLQSRLSAVEQDEFEEELDEDPSSLLSFFFLPPLLFLLFVEDFDFFFPMSDSALAQKFFLCAGARAGAREQEQLYLCDGAKELRKLDKKQVQP